MKLTKKVYEQERKDFIKEYKVREIKVVRPRTLFKRELLVFLI